MLAWQALSPGAISQPHCLQYFPQLKGSTELEKARQSAFTTLHVELERQASVQNRRKHQSWSWGLEGTEGEGPLEGRHCIYN